MGGFFLYLQSCSLLFNVFKKCIENKNPPAVQERRLWSLGWVDPLEEGMATHSSTLAWRIPWTEESDGPQFIGSQGVWHTVATEHSTAQSSRTVSFDYFRWIFPSLLQVPHVPVPSVFSWSFEGSSLQISEFSSGQLLLSDALPGELYTSWLPSYFLSTHGDC